MIELHTHKKIDAALCGEVEEISPGRAKITMTTLPSMAVDDRGLVHGGFIFGLADHAAMIAVNHPHVVLAGADVRFTAPVKAGEELTAEGQVTSVTGKRKTVEVVVKRGGETVFQGAFSCAVLDRHVLEKRT